jgi:hypothetical protein
MVLAEAILAMSGGDKAGGTRGAGAAGRPERLAAALKENLKKRKQQARARRQAEGQDGPAASASKDKPED